ncbi:MAG: acetyl-CoA carboxylase carboxyltransferase subunit beta [Zetaproteobacteria bacterium]|nr:MAG: acetyl-CoA carboxylase carboxyltransferase subunit beta [Zetaproteobacteria bacterium]
MNWLTRLIERPGSLLSSSRKTDVPEGVWRKCPNCSEAIYSKELIRSQMVCSRCGHHQRLDVDGRVAALFDPDSWQEFDTGLRSCDPLGFRDKKRYRDRLKEAAKKAGEGDAVRNFTGTVQGHPIVASIFEFGFMGGSMGSVVGEKLVRAMERAVADGVPYLLVTASGGARMQEGMFSLMQMAKCSAAVHRLHEAGLPFVCLLADPTMGGVSASIAWLGDVIAAEPGALIGFAGPRVIRETVKQELPEGFQRAEFLLEHGLIDAVVDRRRFRDWIATLCGHLTARSYHPEAADD